MRLTGSVIVAATAFGVTVAPAAADPTHASDFEAFWKHVQANCRLLSVKKINWAKIRKLFGPRLRRARDGAECLALLNAVVGKLKAGDVYYTLLPSGVGYVHLRRMWRSRNAFDACFKRAMEHVANAPALIVDLRGNGGGGIGEAFSATFDGRGTGVLPKPWTKKLAVLVDAGTVSAGEGAASLFRERTTARLFGTATAGMSSKKTTFTAPSGLFQVYYSWRGQTNFGATIVEFFGVAPHQAVAIDPAQLYAEIDSAIAAALRWLGK